MTEDVTWLHFWWICYIFGTQLDHKGISIFVLCWYSGKQYGLLWYFNIIIDGGDEMLHYRWVTNSLRIRSDIERWSKAMIVSANILFWSSCYFLIRFYTIFPQEDKRIYDFNYFMWHSTSCFCGRTKQNNSEIRSIQIAFLYLSHLSNCHSVSLPPYNLSLSHSLPPRWC